MTRETFKHYDAINSAPSGVVLIVSEPIRAQAMPSGGPVDLSPGTWLRVKFSGGGLWCEAAIDGRISTIVVNNEDFTSLDFKEPAR